MNSISKYRLILFVLLIFPALVGFSGENVLAQYQNWGPVTSVGTSPVARMGHGLVYDSFHGKTVLFGGIDPQGNYLNDTWEYDAATQTWTDVTPSGVKPLPRFDLAMGFDPVRNKIVIYGGIVPHGSCCGHTDDTWEWDTVSKSWTSKPSAGSLGFLGRRGSRMAFDPNRQQVILFSGRLYFTWGDPVTYAWNGSNWIDISPPVSPSGRHDHVMVTDTARSKVILFGGRNPNYLNDTWEWDGTTWTQKTPAGLIPQSRADAMMSYDSQRQVSVLFGGYNAYLGFGTTFNDTWEWNGVSWTQQQPCDVPPPVAVGTLVYDELNRKHILFGGLSPSAGIGPSGGLGASYPVFNPNATNLMFNYGTGSGIPPCGDAEAPITTLASSVEPNAAGWNNTDIGVQLNATDNENGSGVKEIIYSANGAQTITPTTVNGANANFTITAEGETVISYFARDNAGNTEATLTFTVRIDKTAPSISCDSADGAWHSADVSIACTSAENISSLADSADANFDLTTNVPADTETSNASTDSREVCDVAGNCSTAGSISGNKIDKKAPVITITSPTSGNYLLNQAVTVDYTCTDGGSGVANCIGTTANGGQLDTSSTGAKTFTLNASDNVGNNSSPVVVNYTVGFGLAILFDQTKAHKSGSTVPIKIRLVDANGLNVSSAGTVVHAVSVIQTGSQASTILEDAGNSNPDFDFRYDQSLGGYIFNLQTKGYTTGTYLLNFIAGDGLTIYSVQFQVRQ